MTCQSQLAPSSSALQKSTSPSCNMTWYGETYSGSNSFFYLQLVEACGWLGRKTLIICAGWGHWFLSNYPKAWKRLPLLAHDRVNCSVKVVQVKVINPWWIKRFAHDNTCTHVLPTLENKCWPAKQKMSQLNKLAEIPKLVQSYIPIWNRPYVVSWYHTCSNTHIPPYGGAWNS